MSVRVFQIAVCLATLACSQGLAISQSCPLKIESAPELRGFRIGMSIAEIKKRHPKFEPGEGDVDGYFGQSLWWTNAELAEVGPEDRAGATGIELGFLDSKLIQLKVKYDGFSEWGDIGKFTAVMIERLKLPSEGWEVVDPKTRKLKCTGFTIKIKLDPKQGQYELEAPSVVVVDDNAVSEVIARQKSRKERRQRTFKP